MPVQIATAIVVITAIDQATLNQRSPLIAAFKKAVSATRSSSKVEERDDGF